MEVSMLTSKGQLLIPKRLREKYGIKPGVKITFEEGKEGLVLKPMDKAYFSSFKGILKSTGRLKEELRQMKKEEQDYEEKKWKRLTKKK